MGEYSNLNIFINKEDLYNSFKKTLLISLEKNVDFFLFIDCDIINFDSIKSQLIP